MFYMWLCVIMVLALIEFTTVNLVSIWFVISGILALVVSLVIDNFLVQFAVFVIAGVILLCLTRKFVSKKFVLQEKTNLDRIIGMKGVVTEDIGDCSVGEVLVDGKRWSAIASEPFKKGERVKIVKIDGVKLVVER